MNARQKDVTNAVLGLIKAQDPCTITSLMRECWLQVTNFENTKEFNQICLIDFALNQLLEAGTIEIETWKITTLARNNAKHTTAFRIKS